MPDANKSLAEAIRVEIKAQGPISCARFMELALYHPQFGYYQRPIKQIGCQGDFYTSVSVGSLFGQLLAFQFARWLDSLPSPSSRSSRAVSSKPPLHLVEAGAHDGHLAADIIEWFHQKRPDLLRSLKYWIIEPALERERKQARNLGAFRAQLHWSRSWNACPELGIHGIIFSNELLDAFPVHRLGWDAQRSEERRVGKECRSRWA